MVRLAKQTYGTECASESVLVSCQSSTPSLPSSATADGPWVAAASSAASAAAAAGGIALGSLSPAYYLEVHIEIEICGVGALTGLSAAAIGLLERPQTAWHYQQPLREYVRSARKQA